MDLSARLAELVVTGVDTVATGVVALTLSPGDEDQLPAWKPGAHIDLHLGVDCIRQYSLCGEPADRAAWRIAVLLEPAGRGGSARVHALRPGDRIQVGGPRNHFRFVDAERYRFVAGGIGITPLLPMIAAANRAGAEWSLHYGGRTRGSMAFADDLVAAYGHSVTLLPLDEVGLIDLPSVLPAPTPETLVYCCGPETLLTAVEQHTATWPAGILHTERFAPKRLDPDAAAPEAAFEVEFRASGHAVTVPPGVSILQAAQDVGISVDSSCEEGVCGTCETLVIEGEPDHRDSVLSAAERSANGVMMICCSRSRSPRLVLDL